MATAPGFEDRSGHDHRIVVFYDGSCGLCGREIAHYRRLDGTGRIRWLDISRARDELDRYGVDYQRAMAVFHVRDAAGRLHLGVAAFMELWRHLPYYRRLAAVVRLTGLRRPLEWGYHRFARWRLGRRGPMACTLESGRREAPTAAPHSARRPSPRAVRDAGGRVKTD